MVSRSEPDVSRASLLFRFASDRDQMCLMRFQEIAFPLFRPELVRVQLVNRKARFADTPPRVLGHSGKDVIQDLVQVTTPPNVAARACALFHGT